MAFVAELDFSGDNIVSADMLARHGIIIKGVTDVTQVSRQVVALTAALNEVAEYTESRHHNQPLPSLWVDDPQYVSDVKALLMELRRLNDNLESGKQAKIEKAASAFAVAGKKYIESYAEVMGKGSAYLTIAGIATLCVNLGVDKGTVEAIWSYLKPGK